MEKSKMSFLSVLKSVFMVLLCAVIISVPVLDSYRAYAISETVIAVGCLVGMMAACGLIQGSVSGTTFNLATDPYLRQAASNFCLDVADGAKHLYRTSLGQLKRFKAYCMDKLGLSHDVPTTAAPQTQPVTEPDIFQFNFTEYPASRISYASDGKSVNGVSYDASFLDEHVIWTTGNTSKSIDSREDPYYSSFEEGFYFTGATTRSGIEVRSNFIWTLGDLRYSLSSSGSTYGSTVRWKVFEPLYFINQGTGNRELLLCAVMTGMTGTSNSTNFVFASTPILDVSLNANATNWYEGSSRPPLKAMFGSFNPTVYKIYSQTARNYREYSYGVYDGHAVEATTYHETTTEPSIVPLSNNVHYDPDYDLTQKLSAADDNTAINIPLTPGAKTLGEAIESGTPVSQLTSGQKRQIRDITTEVHKNVSVGGQVTTSEAVTDGSGAVVTPAVNTLTDAVPINAYLDANVTETGEYQGLISRIADSVQSVLDTVKSIPQTITETGQSIVDSIDYQINPNSPQFPDSFSSFFTSVISSSFPSISLFREAFDRFTAQDSPLVLEYDVVLGDHTYHFSADFSWFEAHRARFRSGVGVLFWLLAWLGVIRGFMSIFHVGLGKVGGIAMGNTGAGGSSGATSLDVGGSSGSIPVDSVEYGIWKREGRL